MPNSVFYRSPGHAMPVAAKGDGIRIIDSAGKAYIDASGGAAVSCLGHSDPDVIAAIKAQIDDIAFAHTSFFTSPPAEELGDLLVSKAPTGLEMVYFVSGGSEAVEAALLLARQFAVEKGEASRTRFIARELGYHGNTFGALSVSSNRWRREMFTDMLADVSHIAPCFPYRYQHDGENDEAYAERAAGALEEEILRLGPETVCAFIAETVGGATAGALVPVPGYLKRIREICDKYGVLLILDEVMCGMGRTGTTYACEQEDISPDLLACAKGLGAGYQPVGAVLVSGEIYHTIAGGSGSFRHSHTYMGHPTACAAALAVQRKIEKDDLLANVRTQGANLHEALINRLGNQPWFGEVRGRGLLCGIELVRDRATKETFDTSTKLHERIKHAAMDRGLICYPGSGTADGTRGHHVLLAPPFICNEADINDIADRVSDAISASIQEVA